MLILYRNLERKISYPHTSAADAAKAVDVTSHLALTIHNAETEGLRAIKEMVNLAKSQEAGKPKPVLTGNPIYWPEHMRPGYEKATEEEPYDTRLLPNDPGYDPTKDPNRKF